MKKKFKILSRSLNLGKHAQPQGVAVNQLFPHHVPWGARLATTTAENPRTGHSLYQEDDDQHILRKEATGIGTKTALAPNVLSPPKLHMNSATYKQPSKTTVGNSFS